MITPKRFLAHAAVLTAFALHAAEPAFKFATVDLAKLFDQHPKTVEQAAKLRGDEQKAEEEIARMIKDGNALVEDYKKAAEQANNPALNADAKAKAQAETQKKLETIQAKQNELQVFRNNAGAGLEQRRQTFRNLLLEELTKVSTDVARRRGANALFDKSGPSQFGVPSLLFADGAFDITDDVMKEIKKDSSAATTAPAAKDAPLKLPDLQKKK